MDRWRGWLIPKKPKNLEDLGSFLEQQPWCTLLDHKNGNMTPRTVKSDDGGVAIILYDADFVMKVCGDGSEPLDVHFDATFKTCPKMKGFYQTATLMVNRYGHVSQFIVEHKVTKINVHN